jgi:hypothetical protein
MSVVSFLDRKRSRSSLRRGGLVKVTAKVGDTT